MQQRKFCADGVFFFFSSCVFLLFYELFCALCGPLCACLCVSSWQLFFCVLPFFPPLGASPTELHFDQAFLFLGSCSQAGDPALLNCLTNLSIHFLVNNFKSLILFLFCFENSQPIKNRLRSMPEGNFYN